MSPQTAIDWRHKTVNDRKEATHTRDIYNAGDSSRMVKQIQRWKPPIDECYKVNVDASVFQGVQYLSVNMILKDQEGTFIEGKNIRVQGPGSMFEAEAVAFVNHYHVSCLKELNRSMNFYMCL